MKLGIKIMLSLVILGSAAIGYLFFYEVKLPPGARLGGGLLTPSGSETLRLINTEGRVLAHFYYLANDA
jgi:hypothetical protein